MGRGRQDNQSDGDVELMRKMIPASFPSKPDITCAPLGWLARVSVPPTSAIQVLAPAHTHRAGLSAVHSGGQGSGRRVRGEAFKEEGTLSMDARLPIGVIARSTT